MLVAISVAANLLGVCPKTLRRWEKKGTLMPASRTRGGHRRYETRSLGTGGRPVHQPRNAPCFRAIGYARVSSAKQREDLTRQISRLEAHCQREGYSLTRVYKDVASGLHDGRPGLARLIDRVLEGGIDHVVVSTPDRLARFGTRCLGQVFALHGTRLEVVDKQLEGSAATAEARLVQDVIALVTSFAGKLHRMRRKTTPRTAVTKSEKRVNGSREVSPRVRPGQLL